MVATITLIVPTLNRGRDLLPKCLESLQKGTRQPDQTIIIDNGQQELQEVLPPLPNLAIYEPGENLGFAASCNWALRYCALNDSLWLHCADDVTVPPDLVSQLEHFASLEADEVFFIPETQHVMNETGGGGAFSIFLARPKVLLERVGEMDEQFYPAYFEDNDYARRMKLAGFHFFEVPHTVYYHWISSTLKAYSPEQLAQHHRQFESNREKYLAKWGGLPHHETFTQPYNGGTL